VLRGVELQYQILGAGLETFTQTGFLVYGIDHVDGILLFPRVESIDKFIQIIETFLAEKNRRDKPGYSHLFFAP
jgi:hypothetical protein